MKILLLNPPYFPRYSRPQRSPAVTKSGTLYYPIWLAYATGALEQAGHECLLIDAPAAGFILSDVEQKVLQFKPNLIVIDTSTPSIYEDVKTADRLHMISPLSYIVLVGTHATALPDETFDLGSGFNAIARKEYDETLCDLARHIELGNFKFSEINGLSFKTKEGKIHHNPDRMFIKNLDSLPFVSAIYKKHLNTGDYFNPNALYPNITILAGRGCPFGCNFCLYPQTMTGRKYRYRSIQNIVDEMVYIEETFPDAKAVFFEDDTLTSDKERLIELCRSIRERGIKISWTANSRAELDRETMIYIAKSGCRLLCVGFESAGQNLLDSAKKGIKPVQMYEFMKSAKKAGLLIHGCFMVGFPGETKETLRATLELAKRLNPDTVQFYPMMVYPGTEAYKIYKESGFLTSEYYTDWLTSEGLHNCVVKLPDFNPEDLVSFCDRARREFYLRPGYLWYKLIQSMMHPNEFKRNLKAFKTFRRFLWKGSDSNKK